MHFHEQHNITAKGSPSYHGGVALPDTASGHLVDLMAVSLDGFNAFPSSSTDKPDEYKIDSIRDWTRTLLCIEVKTTRDPSKAISSLSSAAVSSREAAPRNGEVETVNNASLSPLQSSSKRKHSLSTEPSDHQAQKRRIHPGTPPPPAAHPELSSEPLRANEKQLLSYALETICALGDRSHVFGLLVHDMTASMWYYDRSGVVSSQSFHLKNNFDTFIKFVVAFSFISHRDLGYLDEITMPPPPLEATLAPRTLEGSQMKVADKEATIADTVITLGSVLHRQFGLVGRGTIVHDASIANSSDEVVVKMAWQPVTRAAEWEYIQHALAGGFPKRYSVMLHGFARGFKLSEGFRNSIPGMTPAHYEDRELRVMVSEKLGLAVELPNKDFLYALNCIRYCKPFRSQISNISLTFFWPWRQTGIEHLERVGVYHCDISSGNCG
jgi:hypothetical protein